MASDPSMCQSVHPLSEFHPRVFPRRFGFRYRLCVLDPCLREWARVFDEMKSNCCRDQEEQLTLIKRIKIHFVYVEADTRLLRDAIQSLDALGRNGYKMVTKAEKRNYWRKIIAVSDNNN